MHGYHADATSPRPTTSDPEVQVTMQLPQDGEAGYSEKPVLVATAINSNCSQERSSRQMYARFRPAPMSTPRESLGPDDAGDSSATQSPLCTARKHRDGVRPRCLSILSGSTLGMLTSDVDAANSPCCNMALLSPGTPTPNREEFRHIESGVTLVMFDFDGTLTATPGDLAARPQKHAELRQRAAMLGPRLQALQEAGATLGIISKSTESTVRDAVQAAGLSAHFQGPIVGKAISFEGKAGIIDDLAQTGALAGFQSAGLVEQAACHRVLLVDDDVMELERARCAGLQAYAAPPKGGLQEQDFEVMRLAIESPCLLQQRQQQQQQSLRSIVSSSPSPGRSGARRGSPTWSRATSTPSPAARQELAVSDISCLRASGKWQNLILFSGECFEG